MAGADYTYATTFPGSSVSPTDGLLQNVTLGDMSQYVFVGNRERMVGLEENVIIRGKQTIRAAQIFLN